MKRIKQTTWMPPKTFNWGNFEILNFKQIKNGEKGREYSNYCRELFLQKCFFSS